MILNHAYDKIFMDMMYYSDVMLNFIFYIQDLKIFMAINKTHLLYFILYFSYPVLYSKI